MLVLGVAEKGFSLAPPFNLNTSVALYQANCAVCHNDIATSARLTATARKITWARRTVSNMSGVVLKPVETKAIARALKSSYGKSLYTENCSNTLCHGPYENSRIWGKATVGKITRNIVNKNKSGYTSMNSLASKIKLTQKRAIVLAIKDAPVPSDGGGGASVDGATLYYLNGKCQVCHGPISAINPPSLKTATGGQIKLAIHGGVPEMNKAALNSLTDVELAAIAAAIQKGEQPGDPTIFDLPDCTTCHNSDGSLKTTP